jgi:hypothetical protein
MSDRLAIVAALAALEAGETTYATEVLLGAIEVDGPSERLLACPDCSATFQWSGELDHHRRFAHELTTVRSGTGTGVPVDTSVGKRRTAASILRTRKRLRCQQNLKMVSEQPRTAALRSLEIPLLLRLSERLKCSRALLGAREQHHREAAA